MNTAINFKIQQGVMMENLETRLVKTFDLLGFTEYKKIDTDEIVFSADVFKQCEKNTCGMFGKNHGCPPKAGNEAERKARIMIYDTAYVISMILSIKKRTEMSHSMELLRNAIDEIRKEFKDENVTVMGTGPCNICEECTALKNEPCRFPDKTLYSMEGSGIDVVRMSMNLQMTYNAGSGNIAFFALVLY